MAQAAGMAALAPYALQFGEYVPHDGGTGILWALENQAVALPGW